jgi:hypothetical protein
VALRPVQWCASQHDTGWQAGGSGDWGDSGGGGDDDGVGSDDGSDSSGDSSDRSGGSDSGPGWQRGLAMPGVRNGGLMGADVGEVFTVRRMVPFSARGGRQLLGHHLDQRVVGAVCLPDMSADDAADADADADASGDTTHDDDGASNGSVADRSGDGSGVTGSTGSPGLPLLQEGGVDVGPLTKVPQMPERQPQELQQDDEGGDGSAPSGGVVGVPGVLAEARGADQCNTDDPERGRQGVCAKEPASFAPMELQWSEDEEGRA